MATNMNTDKISATKVAAYVDVTVPTLNSWYAYVKSCDGKFPEGMPILPEYEQKSIRAQRWWNKEDLPAIAEFAKWVPHGRNGLMGAINKKRWSKTYLEQREIKRQNKAAKITTV